MSGRRRFRCLACQTLQPVADRHASGYCAGCIARGRRFWLGKFSQRECRELAAHLRPRG